MRVSAQGKRETTVGESKLYSSRHIFVFLFLQEGSFACKESLSALWIQRKRLAGFHGL